MDITPKDTKKMETAILYDVALSSQIYTLDSQSADPKEGILANFAVLADLHLYRSAEDAADSSYDLDNKGKGNGLEDFYRALLACKAEKVDFVAACGDIGDAPKYETESGMTSYCFKMAV